MCVNFHTVCHLYTCVTLHTVSPVSLTVRILRYEIEKGLRAVYMYVIVVKTFKRSTAERV